MSSRRFTAWPTNSRRRCIQSGHRVREYCAVGELLPGMAYFVRRLLENTSNEGFLRQKEHRRSHHGTVAPQSRGTARYRTPRLSPAKAIRYLRTTRPTPTSRSPTAASGSARPSRRSAPASAGNGPLIIGGRKIADREYVPSVNPGPARADRRLLGPGDCGRRRGRRGRGAAPRSPPGGPRRPRSAPRSSSARPTSWRRAAWSSMRSLILEAGKPWIEADADISEAIDFCRFYAAEMRRLGRPAVTQRTPGEHCVQIWTPRGVAVADRAVELSAGDPHRPHRRAARRRQRRHHEARPADFDHRRRAHGHPRRGGRAAGRAQLPALFRRGGRRPPRRPSAGRCHCLHRLARRRLPDLGNGRPHAAGPGQPQEGRLRDGRQERAHHRQRRRPRRGHPRRALLRVRLQRARNAPRSRGSSSWTACTTGSSSGSSPPARACRWAIRRSPAPSSVR